MMMMPAPAAYAATPGAPTATYSSAAQAYAALSKGTSVQQATITAPATTTVSYAAPTTAPVAMYKEQAVSYGAVAAAVPSQGTVTYAAPAAAPTYGGVAAAVPSQGVTYAAPVAAPTYGGVAATMPITSTPAVSSYVGQLQVAPAVNNTVVKSRVGDWQICQDELGEFYSHTPSGQTFDQPPAELLVLLGVPQPAQVVSQPAQVVVGGQPVTYVQESFAPVVTQTPSYTGPQVVQAAPVMAQAAPVVVQAAQGQSQVKEVVGDWMICQDNLGEFYSHTPSGQTFDQAPPELLMLLGQAPVQYAAQPAPVQYAAQAPAPVQYAAQAPAVVSYTEQPAVMQAPTAVNYMEQPQVVQQGEAPTSMVKSIVGDFQICEDAQGEFYCYMPTGQTFDEPPAELLQLLG